MLASSQRDLSAPVSRAGAPKGKRGGEDLGGEDLSGETLNNGEIGFERPVPPGGYHWWYLDALSDEGRHGLTVIAFIGSVFSPYYAWSGRGDPQDHCALNIGLYGAGGKRWAMTERNRATLRIAPQSLTIGPSALTWDGGGLTLDVDELAVPHFSRIKGRLRIFPEILIDQHFRLDGQGLHDWRPIAPRARIEVALQRPALTWRGEAYLDCNWGGAPLEAGFQRWNWSRASLREGAAVLYDVTRREGDGFALALRFRRDGTVEDFDGPPASPLPRTLWGISRATQSEAGQPARLEKTLEDTPFYARSLISAQILGEPVKAMHESLNLDRFASPWVKLLLPFRMPRRRH